MDQRMSFEVSYLEEAFLADGTLENSASVYSVDSLDVLS